MGDEDLRRLERAAARGDAEAAARLARQQVRHGRSATWTLAATWRLDEADRASDALFTPDGRDLIVVTRKAVRVLDPTTGELRGQVGASLFRGVGGAAVWEGRSAVGAPRRADEVTGRRAPPDPAGPAAADPGARPSASPAAGALGIRLRARAGPSVSDAVRARSRPRLVIGEVQTSSFNGGGCAVLAASLSRGQPHALHEFADDVDAVAAGGDLAVAASGTQVRAWTGPGGVISWTNPFPVRALAVSSAGRRVLVVGERGASTRDLWGPDELARAATGLPLAATGALSADGALAVTATRAAIHVWDATSGARLHELACPEPPVRSVSSSPGGVLAVAFADRVGLWHVDTGLSLGTTPPVELPVVAAALDPTERLLVAVNPSRLWVFRRSD